MYLIAGCGFRPIIENGVALDINWEYIEKSRVGSAAVYVQGDLRCLPFRDGVFNRITCWNILEHVEEKETIVSELHRTAAEGATVEISGGLRVCDQLLGRLSRIYNTKVTREYHKWTAPSAEYLELVGQYFEIDHVRYPCNAIVFLIVLLMDPFRVDVNEAGEYLGSHAERVLLIAELVGRLIQPIFNLLGSRYHEYLSQSITLHTKKQSSRRSLNHFTVTYGSPTLFTCRRVF